MIDTEPYLVTNSGNLIYINQLERNTYNIEDIAHSLANQCRWNGHTNKFYSVAQHSVEVSHVVYESYQLQGLMHDCTESVIGDIPKPFKDSMPQLVAYEDTLHWHMFQQFGISYPIFPAVHIADMGMLLAEAKILFDDVPEWTKEQEWQGYQEYPKVGKDCWSPAHAKAEFLYRFNEINHLTNSTIRAII